MRFLLLLTILSMGSLSLAGWTMETPESGTVWSYDRECVDLKLKDGKTLRVQKKALGLRKLEPRKTIVEFHKDMIDKDLCQ